MPFVTILALDHRADAETSSASSFNCISLVPLKKLQEDGSCSRCILLLDSDSCYSEIRSISSQTKRNFSGSFSVAMVSTSSVHRDFRSIRRSLKVFIFGYQKAA